jgi:hypothetical protein
MTPFGRGDEAESALLFPAPNTQGGHFPPMLRQLRHVGRIGTFIALTLLAGNIGFAAAQTSTPILVAPVGTIGTVDYPISIHQGTCESPVAQPDYTLTNATPWAVDNENAKEKEIGVNLNPDPLVPVVPVSESAITAKFDDVTGTPYVLAMPAVPAVHASPEGYETIVACGEIAGTGLDGKLVIRLASVGDGNVAGIAVIEKGKGLSLNLDKDSFDLKDDQARITVYLSRL